MEKGYSYRSDGIQLREYFGTQVLIKGENRGKIEIEFYSEDDLQRILEILNIEEQ